MLRREMLSATAGSFGAVSFGDLDTDFDVMTSVSETAGGEELELTMRGTGDVQLATRDGQLQSLLSVYEGRVKGTISGSYSGSQIALVYGEEYGEGDHHESSASESDVSLMHDDVDAQHEFNTDRARVTGVTELTSPDHEMAQNSKYTILVNGWITDCCNEDFNFEGKFKSIEATGRFAGTEIQGELRSKTDLGYPLKTKATGVKIEK